jgi:hypothetical protein
MGYEDESLPESRLFSTKTAVKKGGGSGGRRRHFDLAAICRKDGKKKFVELGMVRHDCGDRFGKCDFVSHFHDPFICAGPEGENVYQ